MIFKMLAFLDPERPLKVVDGEEGVETMRKVVGMSPMSL
jgi:hypothetical protein